MANFLVELSQTCSSVVVGITGTCGLRGHISNDLYSPVVLNKVIKLAIKDIGKIKARCVFNSVHRLLLLVCFSGCTIFSVHRVVGVLQDG